MTREEAEALGLLREEHFAEVAVAEADLSVIGDGAGDAEGLEADADGGSSVGSLGAAALDSDGAADGVSPDGVLKADGLGLSHYLVAIDALSKSDFFAFFDGRDAVLGEDRVDLIYSSFVAFK